MAILLGPKATFGEEPWSSVVDPIFYHPKADGDSPRPPVLAIAQDHNGFLWVGTEDGILRWDGYRYRAYRSEPGNPRSLPDNYIQVLHVDARGVLWIGTLSGGLSRYDPATDEFVNYGDGTISNIDVRSIADDGIDGIWAATNQGLEEVSAARGVLRHMSHVDADLRSLPDNDVRAVLRDSEGHLWIGTRGGAVRRDHTGEPFLKVPMLSREAHEPSVTCLYEDSAGRIWIGTNRGAYVFDPRANGPGAAVVGGSEAAQIESLTEATPGQMWLGTYGRGILIVDVKARTIRSIRHDPMISSSLDEDTLWSLFRDREGVLWLGTNRGFSRHDPRQLAIRTIFGVVSRKTGLSDSDVEAVLPMANGQIWAGLGASGVDILDPEAGRVAHLGRGVDRFGRQHELNEVRALAATPAGDVFLCARAGLYRKRPFDQEPEEVSLPQGVGVRAVATSTAGDLVWLGTLNDGLWALPLGKTGEARPYDNSSKLTDPRVSVILTEPAGGLWVGTFNGLNHVDPSRGTIERIDAKPGRAGSLPTPYVTAIMIDRGGRLWVGTQSGGVSILEGRGADGRPRFHHLGRAEGLPDLNIDKLVEDSLGRIWAATDAGIAVIDSRTLTAHALGRAEGVAIGSYWINSGTVTPDGTLAFGGVDGLTLARPERLVTSERRPPSVVSEVRVGGARIPWNPADHNTSITIAPQSNSVSVEFATLDYASPEQVRYAYRLQGFDRSWVAADSLHRVATYTNLPPGRYLLQVRAGSGESSSMEPTLTVPIEVEPAWYQTFGFRLGYTIATIAVLAALIALGHHILIVRQQRRERARHSAILETLTQNLPDTLLLVDRDLRVRFSNRPLTPSQVPLVGESLADAVPHDVSGPLVDAVRQVMQSRSASSFECRWEEHDGKSRVFEQRAAPVIAENELLGVAMRSTDITERKMLDERLRIQARVLDLMTEGVVVLDVTGRVLLANKAMLLTLRFDADHLTGQLLAERAAGAADQVAITRILRTNDPGKEEIRLRREDGSEVLIAIAVSPVGIESIPGIICACRDVSEERAIERVIADAAARDARSLGTSLHEGLAQELSGISFFMSGIGRAVRGSTSGGDVRAVSHYIEQAISTARTLAQRISPTTPMRGSLSQALAALAAASKESLGIEVRYRGATPKDSNDGPIGDQLYRMASDLITFGASELDARVIEVKIGGQRNEMTLEIRIDRPPSNLAASRASRRMADIITYRARLIGGSCLRVIEGNMEVFAVTIPSPTLGNTSREAV